MRAKLSVLRACRQLLRPGGRMGFYTMYPSPGLTDTVYRRVVRVGAPGLGTFGREHRELLASAGFREVAEADVTREFLRVARGWLQGREQYSSEFRAIEGDSEFARGQAQRRRTVKAIDEGLVRRSLFVVERPG